IKDPTNHRRLLEPLVLEYFELLRQGLGFSESAHKTDNQPQAPHAAIPVDQPLIRYAWDALQALKHRLDTVHDTQSESEVAPWVEGAHALFQEQQTKLT